MADKINKFKVTGLEIESDKPISYVTIIANYVKDDKEIYTQEKQINLSQETEDQQIKKGNIFSDEY